MAHPYEWYEAYGSPVWAMDPGYESDMDMEVKVLSRVRLFETPWTVTCQAPQSMGFSRQEY